MFTANKTYRKYRTGNYFFPDLKKNKNEIGKYQSGDSVEQDINLVWPNKIFCFMFQYNIQFTTDMLP